MNGGDRVRAALDEAIKLSCSDMAFLDVMPRSSDESLLDVNQIFSLEFHKPVQGELVLYLPLEFKRALVENVLADDWDSLGPNEKDDCLLEFLNVLGGNFLETYLGQEVAYQMSFPQILFDTDSVDPMIQEYYYDAEGMLFKIGVAIESDADGEISLDY